MNALIRIFIAKGIRSGFDVSGGWYKVVVWKAVAPLAVQTFLTNAAKNRAVFTSFTEQFIVLFAL